ncbi:hypothetical protein KRR39_17655 [Nocardioides panacis]|uniref:Uncharacterized protein n=1 Tax=Nocardioides panacis TaxID=2849501 RepID=A0A975SXJ3_9ACTN|nr:hypothetical protein [Nocardioides panacis]QWZ07275.1 hypothetical protein KRR39_17655 [Nocardioides panacis]
MLTDEQIATMSPAERHDLIRRLVRPVDDLVPSRRWLRRTRELRILLLVVSAAALVPWIVYLAVSLPPRYVAHNWDVTWVGFDVLLLVLMVATAVLGYLRRQMLVLTAFATGVLLVCDAWFDVLTAHGDDQVWSLATALLVELPLAAVLITGSMQILRLVAARLWALDDGAHAWQVQIPLPSDADRAVGRPARVR